MCETLTERSYSTNNIVSYLYLSCKIRSSPAIIMQKAVNFIPKIKRDILS